ncbi:putative AC transposase [Glycine max]|nr:putative AC transposase [Glycine max]
MAITMKEMFYKYWSEYCVAFAFGCVLDLKEKFNFIRFCYKRLYPFDYKVRVDKVKDDTSNDGKSQLDIYLSKATLVGGDDLDALQYWKLNKHRFYEVARMACDILSISITTMPSKSSLSIGGCIYNKYIKCLHLENVQTIICTHNWLHGYEEFGDLDVKEVKEMPLFT